MHQTSRQYIESEKLFENNPKQQQRDAERANDSEEGSSDLSTFILAKPIPSLPEELCCDSRNF